MSSATPGPERSSPGGSRLSFWHRDPVTPGPGEEDDDPAAEVLGRSADVEDDPVVVGRGRWNAPAPTEDALAEHAVRARTEAQRRVVAEQLAIETAEQAAAANAARAEAEEAALRATLEREAAEARARAQAEAAERALAERSAAEVRAQELAASLEETRAALLEQTKATLAAQQAQASAPAPSAVPAPAATAASPPEPRIRPDGVPDVVEFRSPSSSAVITVLLGIGALVAAAAAVYEAYLDRLTTPSGLVASAVTLVLVIVVGRARSSAGRVWLERGVLHVEEGDSHRRFDLTTPDTKVEMVGRPGSRRWKVLFLRKGMAPYEVNAGLVDPEPFVEAIRPYRPQLNRS
ncbi:MAG TPA: hypothetical protein VFI19_02020 [Nocardioides sp.]|nr:hypothetical protein [Nocardioides sp.]